MIYTDEEIQSFFLEAGQRLKAFRQTKKLVQRKFADICGIAQNTLSQIESGKIGITSSTLYNLSSYFPDFDAYYILTGKKKEVETAPTEGVEKEV